MTKDEIITAVCGDTGVSKATIEIVIESLFGNITQSLVDGQKVQFAGFGTFEPKHRAARTGRNPHTGEAVPIPARRVPWFKPGKSLKDAVCNEDKV